MNTVRNQKQHDLMTKTPMTKLILRMSSPTIVSMLVSSIYNTADTFFVSQLGTSASGAVGVVFPLTAILQAVGFMIGSGAGSRISIYLGEGNTEEADKVASSAVFASVLGGIVLGVLCKLFLAPILSFVGATETILPYAEVYANYILLGFPIMCASFVFNHLLRCQGKTAFSMIGISTGGILNIFLDPVFIFTFNMGIAGAAIATILSQTVSLILLLVFVQSRHSVLKISLAKISGGFGVYSVIIRIGAPSFFRQGLASISSSLLNNRVKIYGDAAVAAFSIVGKVSFIIMAIMLGVGQGFQPVAGYNYGARNYRRVRSAYKVTLLIGCAMMSVAAVICFIFAPNILAVFRPDDPDVINIGSFLLRVQAAVLPLMSVTVSTNMLLQSLAQNKEATFLALTRQGLYFIPLIFILSSLLGLFGIQITQSISDTLSMLTAIPFAVRFFRKIKEKEAEWVDDNTASNEINMNVFENFEP
ncbi:multidrug export protein MepA [Thermoclostridium stercorarium subsp. stercorarium DSM 8532]|jgi:putative MATE family efflux protein|uniref:Multidrug export protein MepA n=2 Tax=Thermoclostridium stercorarium TaxID=1510 RepID=L7VKM6_THES1|nr:MATE family efflux transporter [Thermoclostridium stercorarium]AGC68665.1 multidrug export protein MepA [Thermoclostridium stercorarium subsp. stercorarium DSM 8532]AGI39676.1 efflux protein [Thermoclostridium stercorarium subsp. stercorarium DSM 8532]ANW99002.1 MATE family efflux transporter [Thermoclostridium stercorarium subsp. thermolacticum DSM 2910]UZQ84646.1 MATE family efflux transporter [Thermoclostridium stercorarium]